MRPTDSMLLCVAIRHGGGPGRRSRARLGRYLLLLVVSLAGGLSAAQSDAPGGGEGTPLAAVDRGLAALARLQTPAGDFTEGPAVTALAGMAFLAGGSTATRGPYHAASARCLQAVISHQDPVTGYLSDATDHMYGHGFATLYLAESYGMAPALPVRRSLEAALDLIAYAQNQDGGWRYDPTPSDADLSITICQVMALRAAYNVGVGGDQCLESMQRALAYVRRCANHNGSFRYQPERDEEYGSGSAEGVGRTAAGCMCLIGMGVSAAADRHLGPGLAYLRRFAGAHLRTLEGYYWYSEYYAAQAMFHSPDPADWPAYWAIAQPVILARQEAEGLWTQGEGPGPAYATAMALIILQIPNDYLPIFQR